MEFKHFSHNHGLAFHHIPQGSEIQCSGCKSPASGNAYVCWQCSYFLHEQCFRAARSVKYPSHPLHPLTLVPFPTYPSGSFFCNSCKHGGDGFSYTCSKCEFDIHVHCALTPDPNSHVSPSPLPVPNYSSQPQNPIYPPHSATILNDQQNYPPHGSSISKLFHNVNPACPSNPPHVYPQPEPATIIKHFSHPHVLKSMEIEQKNGKVCSACEWEISGSVYCCTEPHCSFILDKSCFDSPREVRHKSHLQHSLTLVNTPPYGEIFECYACWRSGKSFAYVCLTCSITLHIDCIGWPETVPPHSDHDHALTLYYSAAEASGQEVSFTCGGCEKPVDQKAWRYYCRECSVGVHTRCRMKQQNATAAKTEDVKDQLLRMQELKMNLDLQMEMARVNAQFIASIGNSWKTFID